jgi:DNA-3-methyladenine glycosylase II
VTPLQHLQNSDPILAAAIEKVGPLEERGDAESHFHALCRIVVGQQLSVAVARAIWNRVVGHFGDDFTPKAVASMSAEDGKSVGLSRMKTIYLQSLATHILGGKLEIERLETLPDEEIKNEIVAVKGLGPWSADMFLMFQLDREDILPVGDLGIREAIKRLYNLDERPDAAKMEEIAEPWRPYRTLASRYLWRSLELPKN